MTVHDEATMTTFGLRVRWVARRSHMVRMNINTAKPEDHRISAQNAKPMLMFENAPYSIACTKVETMLATQSSPMFD